MKKLCTSLLLIGMLLFFSTPALAGYLPVIQDSRASLIFGVGLVIFGIVGNRRFLKR